VNGFRGFLLIAFGIPSVKIYTDDLSLPYDPHCLCMNAYNILGRWCLRVIKKEWQKWIHNLENLGMRRLNKTKIKKKIIYYLE
jgi:hypothetical protein